MIPLMLNPALVRLGLCGEGPLTLRRLKWLRDCGANPIVFAPDPSDELAIAAGVSLRRSIPDHKELTTLSALWIADFASDIANPLADLARATRVLVNVEDVMDYCDFQTPAIVRRGRLTLSISTGGASPAIASNIWFQTFNLRFWKTLDLRFKTFDLRFQKPSISGFKP